MPCAKYTLSKFADASENICAMVLVPPQQKKRADLCSNTKSALNHQPSKERLKIMTIHGSATALEETPHVTETNTTTTNSDALKRRAQSIINDNSIDGRWRAVIRYALETNDPWLADLVRRADDDEPILDTIDFSLEPATREYDSSEEKVELLTEIICRTGEQPAAALFVLMATLEHSTHPKLLANEAKHCAFTRCAEVNLFRIVDAQIELIERRLLTSNE
jgi:hypothetical protein